MISSEFEIRENNKKIMFKTRVLLFLIIFTIYYNDKNFSLICVKLCEIKFHTNEIFFFHNKTTNVFICTISLWRTFKNLIIQFSYILIITIALLAATDRNVCRIFLCRISNVENERGNRHTFFSFESVSTRPRVSGKLAY